MPPLMELLFDYGLFLAKTLTLLLALVVLLIVVVRARASGQPPAPVSGRLEVVDLGARLRDQAMRLRQATLTGKALREAHKAERKHDKQRAQASATRPRLFVIEFKGDIRATEAAALRALVSALLLEARSEDEVLVRLDNAGGMVSEHGLAASQLARLRERGIRLTVAVDKVAASGGYLMACVADRIIAAPFAVLGSIGVLAEIPNFHRLLERHGVDFELHTAGEHKRTLTLFGENTEEGRRKLREQLEETHALFKRFVAEYRPGLDLDRVATGEYWHGTRAVELGLVDAIQTSDDYLLAASDSHTLLGLSWRVRKPPLERLLEGGRAVFEQGVVRWRQPSAG
ncbi:protease SohB [Marichromatium bheemlicum]|uniref:Protease SohB n=1 Tax=Marichromatium bheemlicum TaxID=365339 RepID=A0ABX1I462_9GAMM|nr:protease SohB [Marichromatium bheemlicum]NKN31639.1 protease SohB [Marichromatium bheemlicum]